MDEYSGKSELPNLREQGIEDKQHCEEKQIAGIPNADKTLNEFANLQLDESCIPSTSGKIQKISKKTRRISDDLDTSKKSWTDVQYSPYTVIKNRESGRPSVVPKLQDLAPSVPITDAQTRDPKGESSAVGSIKSEGGTEKASERQIYEWGISERGTEPMSYDERRKNRKRKSYQKTTEILDDPEEPSACEKARDTEGGSSGLKRKKSEKDHATPKTGENVSELEETKAPLKIILTPATTKDGSLNYSIKKNTMDEPSARKIIVRRTEVPDQTLGSKISSTIDEEFRISSISDPAKPSTSGENRVLSKKPSDAEKTRRVLADVKMEMKRLDIYRFLKLSEKEDQIFDEQSLALTSKVMSFLIKKHVKTFFTEHLTNKHNPTALLSNARKLDDSLGKINDILWAIPKLHLVDNASGGVKTLFDLIIHLKRGPLRRAIMGEAFDLNKIDRVRLMKIHESYVHRSISMFENYDTNRDNVYKKMEVLQTIVKEAIEKCEEGKKFIDQLKKSKFLKAIAVMLRSHQIGEDITRPPHVGYNVSDSYLEKIKKSYLNPIPCTDQLHALHTQRSASCPDMNLSLHEVRDRQPQNSLGNSLEDLENIERACREFLQVDSSDENEMNNFQGKEQSVLVLNPNTSKYLPGQLLVGSSDVQQNSTDPSNQLTQKIGSIGEQETSTDTTSQPQFHLIPSMSTSGIERASTDTESKHFQPTPVIEYKDIQQSSTDTGSQLFQLLTGSNDMKRQTDTNCKQNQPQGCTDVQQCLTDPNCQTITTFGKKIKMSSNPDTSIQRSLELQEQDQNDDLKDQNKSDAKISSDTCNIKPLDISFSADNQFVEPSEQKTVTHNTESNPMKISEEFPDPDSPQNQVTSTPIKRVDDREHMDCTDSRELLEDIQSVTESFEDSENFSTDSENFATNSSSDSDFMVCDKSMELDEINDQLNLLVNEIEEFRKSIDNILHETYDAIKKLVDSKEKIYQNVLQFLRTKIPDLIKK